MCVNLYAIASFIEFRPIAISNILMSNGMMPITSIPIMHHVLIKFLIIECISDDQIDPHLMLSGAAARSDATMFGARSL